MLQSKKKSDKKSRFQNLSTNLNDISGWGDDQEQLLSYNMKRKQKDNRSYFSDNNNNNGGGDSNF